MEVNSARIALSLLLVWSNATKEVKRLSIRIVLIAIIYSQ